MSLRPFFFALLVAAACQSANTKAETTPPSAPPAAPAAQASGSQAQPATGVELDPKMVVARMKGREITAGELNESVKNDLQRAETEYRERVYQIRHQALESMVIKPIIEEKAKAKGVPAEQFAQDTVKSRVAEPTDKDVQDVYAKAGAAGKQLPPIDQVRPQIVNYLKGQRMQEAATKYYAELKKEAKVEILLPVNRPPRVTVSTEGPSKGPAKAPVTIVEFSDFECPYCGRAETTVSQVLDLYKGKIRLVYRDFPLPMHQFAQKASEAAFCAQDQGKYWEMHDKLFSHQEALGVPALKGYAKELKLDGTKFDKCLDSGAKAEAVTTSRKAGEAVGVSGTPAFFINGMMISGALPVEDFQNLIDAELAQK